MAIDIYKSVGDDDSRGVGTGRYDPFSSEQWITFHDPFFWEVAGNGHGNLGWVGLSSGTGGNIGSEDAISGENTQGVIHLLSGQQPGYAHIRTNENASLILGQQEVIIEWYAQLTHVPTGTTGEDFVARLGLSDRRFSTNSVYGVEIKAQRSENATNFVGVSIDNTTKTSKDLGVAMDTNWHYFKIHINPAASNVNFYVDSKTTIAASIQTNIPSSNPISPHAEATSIDLSSNRGWNLDDFVLSYRLVESKV